MTERLEHHFEVETNEDGQVLKTSLDGHRLRLQEYTINRKVRGQPLVTLVFNARVTGTVNKTNEAL